MIILTINCTWFREDTTSYTQSFQTSYCEQNNCFCAIWCGQSLDRQLARPPGLNPQGFSSGGAFVGPVKNSHARAVVHVLKWLSECWAGSLPQWSGAARLGLTVGNNFCVIVHAVDCWWRTCLCVRSNNGNIKYLGQIIITTHFLATTEMPLITGKLKVSKHTVKRLYLVEMMKICPHTPSHQIYVLHQHRGATLYIMTAAYSRGKPLQKWLDILGCCFEFRISLCLAADVRSRNRKRISHIMLHAHPQKSVSSMESLI